MKKILLFVFLFIVSSPYIFYSQEVIEPSTQINENIVMYLLKTYGIKGILFYLLLTLIIPFVYFIWKIIKIFFDKIVNKEIHETEKLNNELTKTIIESFPSLLKGLENIVLEISELKNHLQVSISYEKLKIITENFLGISKDFISDCKYIIFSHIENNTFSTIIIEKSLKSLLKERVINNIHHFVFNDFGYLNVIEKQIYDRLESFCQVFLKQINLESEMYRQIINEKLFELNDSILSIIIDEYKRITENNQLTLMKERN